MSRSPCPALSPNSIPLACAGHDAQLWWLLQGSEKFAKSFVLDKQDFDGSTPLMLASGLPDASVRNALCSLLVEAGADVKPLSRQGTSAADVAVKCGDAALGQMLIDLGAPAATATVAAVAAAATAAAAAATAAAAAATPATAADDAREIDAGSASDDK
eukprot:COSAG02_NODE_760_length_17479_cov_23.555178_2_plen_159_part_00